jgi:serine/threonine-protein kinase
VPELEIGSVFAGHRIEGIAGKGGMGVVYRATHLALDHVVAMKVIAAGLAADEVFRERFRSESRIAVSIRHPNVVQIHHAGEEDGLIFVTMDLIDGTDMRKLLNKEGRLAPERAVDLVIQTAAALDAAHSKGLVHRDVKPGNILIEERAAGEHAYLTDFGLTKRVEATSGVTQTGAFVGTLDYVAPEQIKGGRTDARTDVYALGCVLFETLTGQPPFASQEDKVAKIYAHLQEEPPPLLARGRNLPEGLDAVVERALEKEPGKRFPSAGDLARAAEAALEYKPVDIAEHTVAVGAAAPDSDPAIAAGATQAAEPPPDVIEAAEEAQALEDSGVVDPDDPEALAVAEAASEGGETQATQIDKQAHREAKKAKDEAAKAAEKAGRGPRRLPTPAAILLGLVTIGAAVAIVAAMGSGGGDTKTSSTPTNQTTNEPPKPPPKAKIFGATAVPNEPVNLTVGEGFVWVPQRKGGAVTPIDQNNGKAGAEIAVGTTPEGIVTSPGAAWVANAGGGTVQKITVDPSGNSPGLPIKVGTDPRGLAYGKDQDTIFVANSGSDSISTIDATSGTIADPAFIQTDDEPHGILVDGNFLYVVNRLDASVQKFDIDNPTAPPVSTKLGAAGETGSLPKGIALEGGHLWVSVTNNHTVAELEPENLDLIKTLPAGQFQNDETRGIASGLGFVWVVEGNTGQLARIDPAKGRVDQTLDLKMAGCDGLTVAKAVWVACGGSSRVVRVTQGP